MPAQRGRQGRSRQKRAASDASEREQLLSLLLKEAMRQEEPALSEGVPARWRLDLPAVTLTTRGAELSGGCLLRLLEAFEGLQLVAASPRSLPLLQACVMLSRGKYRGLLTRPGEGSHLTLEGKVDPAQPVLFVHDAIGEGSELEDFVSRLEQSGLRVEGGVCLVRSGYEGAFSRLRSRGIPVFALYDTEELSARMPGGAPRALNPGRVLPPHEVTSEKAPEGLQPVELARQVIAEALRSGKLLRPPRRLAGRYSGPGGVWVSVYSKDAPHELLAHNGFWNFPEEKAPALAIAVSQAAFLAARQLTRVSPEPLATLERSAISVTFCAALEPCEVAQLDSERHGLVVRSRERPYLVGGAPPRMPGISNAWQQLEHARTLDARLLPTEPFTLYRYSLQEVVEPGLPPEPSRVESKPPVEASPKTLGESVSRLTPPLCKFLLRHLGATARYEPSSDAIHQGLDTARLAHQAWALARAHRKLGPAPLGEGARTLLTALTSDLVFDDTEHVWIRADEGASISQVALVLLALLETGEDMATAQTLAATLWSRMGVHGRFSCYLEPAADGDPWQDSMPGQALLALARAAQENVHAADAAKLAQAWRFYRHRFRYKRHWDQVSWLTQAAVAWWHVDRDAEAARLAFEICDWALTYQSETTGAFLNDHQPDAPGATTALYLEALAAGAELAAGLRDRTRQQRYLDACARGVSFLDTLVIQEREAALLPNPRHALGGVRSSLERSEVQVESVQHALLALLALRR
ncbi:AMMECR1 domain-containing protein [Hyalangium rubrum]|uniref:AMMECR1 domain-containing protein n=1 Tax=Hyalangium rubrum TaxID=3103134 RepID=A0ABU5H3U1_9BACT|nr:AMMECR1 domain-containing protein [Hyalangium sp. s54d21]MDY7227769.1 hypothetical protein [Hyalangium sp. s54d21]